MQLVQVKFDNTTRAYTYAWRGDAHHYLGVGDRVVVPASWANPDAQFATVVELGSSYRGKTVDLLGYIDRDNQVTYGPDGRPVP